MQHIPELDRGGLRNFSFVMCVFIVLLFGIAFPWIFDAAWPVWPWILGGVLATFGLVFPMGLQPVYRTWMKFGLLLNKITTPVIMAMVYYLLITPTGLIRSLFAKDPLARKLGRNSNNDSYRITSKKRPRKSLERPF